VQDLIDLGGVYPAAMNVFDAAGNPTNAGTISLTITLPDATTVNPSVANPPAVVGQYTSPYVTPMPGRFSVRWVTGSPVTVWTDVFDVAEANPPSIISLAAAKRQIGLDDTDTSLDDMIRGRLAAITASVEGYVRETIVRRTIVEKHDEMRGSWPLSKRLRLLHYPVISLTSIVTALPSAPFSWDVSQLDVDLATGLVRVMSGPPLQGHMVTTHVAGYQQIPYNYIEGSKLLFQHVWEAMRGPGGRGGVTGPEELSDYRHADSFPRKVKEYLDPPRPVIM
jgi:hypothetical protein